MGVFHLTGTANLVGLQSADTEGQHTSTDDIYLFTVLVTVFLEVDIEEYRDGIVASPTCVHVGAASHTRKVGIAVNAADASPVVV